MTSAGPTASSTKSGVGMSSTGAGRDCGSAPSRSAPGNRAMAASVAATSATAVPRNGVFTRRGQTIRIARAMPKTANVSKRASASRQHPELRLDQDDGNASQETGQHAVGDVSGEARDAGPCEQDLERARHRHHQRHLGRPDPGLPQDHRRQYRERNRGTRPQRPRAAEQRGEEGHDRRGVEGGRRTHPGRHPQCQRDRNCRQAQQCTGPHIGAEVAPAIAPPNVQQPPKVHRSVPSRPVLRGGGMSAKGAAKVKTGPPLRVPYTRELFGFQGNACKLTPYARLDRGRTRSCRPLCWFTRNTHPPTGAPTTRWRCRGSRRPTRL